MSGGGHRLVHRPSRSIRGDVRGPLPNTLRRIWPHQHYCHGLAEGRPGREAARIHLRMAELGAVVRTELTLAVECWHELTLQWMAQWTWLFRSNMQVGACGPLIFRTHGKYSLLCYCWVTSVVSDIRNPIECSRQSFPVLHCLCYYRAQFMDIHTLQFCDRLFHGYQNHDKGNRLEIKQKRHKDGLEFSVSVRVSSGPEPKSTNPNPLNLKAIAVCPCANWSKHTSWRILLIVSPVPPLTIECILLLFIWHWQI